MAIIIGTPNDDILDGTADPDIITGFAGNDTITGGLGDDIIDGGTGNDVAVFNVSTDGADSINLGLEASDRITVNATAVTNVRLTFTSAEVGNGNANDSNTLANQDGGLAVRLQAENGSDGLTGPVTRTDDEGVIYVGGTGVTFDVRDLPSGVSRGNAFEVAVLGTSADDIQTAVQNTRPYYFNGGAGNDTQSGGTGNDFFAGGAGNDRMTGFGGNNGYLGGGGIDTVDYSAATGAVFVNLAAGTGSANGYGGTDTFNTIENVAGSSGTNTLIGDAMDNSFSAGNSSDYLIGGAGNDVLSGGGGAANALQGGLGNDVYIVSAVGDSITEFAGEGTDVVDTVVASFTLPDNVENLVFSGTGNFTGTGNAGANVITGGAGNDSFAGMGGDDVINGGAGTDVATFNITTDGADSINLGLEATDRITVNATAATNVRMTFTSAEVGNGNAFDSNTLANQDGGLAVRLQAENGSDVLTGPVTRTDDEGVVYVAGAGVTFDVRDLPTGVARGNLFEVAVLGTSADDVQTAVQNARPYYFNGGAGNDTQTGGTGNDFFAGGAGNDRMSGFAGNNSYLGGGGIDTVDYSAATGSVFVNLAAGTASANGFGGTDTFNTIENVAGSAGSNTIIGDAADNFLGAGNSSDYLIGGGGNDVLSAGSGAANALQGGVGNDVYLIAAVGDSITEFAGEGSDIVDTVLNSFTLAANVENLIFSGTGNFTGTGNADANVINGGAGADILSGLGGDDTLRGNAGADVFRFTTNGGIDGIVDFLSGTDKIALDGSAFVRTASVAFVQGAGAQGATTTNSTFLYDTSTGILSYDADGTGAGAAVNIANLGSGTALVQADLMFY